MRPLNHLMPEFGCLGNQKPEPLTPAEMNAKLAERVAVVASKALPGVGMFLVFVWMADALGGRASAGAAGTLATAVAALTPFLLSFGLGSGRIPARLAHAAVALTAAIALLQAALRFGSSPSVAPLLHIVVVLVGSSAILLSWRWLVAVHLASFIACGLAAAHLHSAAKLDLSWLRLSPIPHTRNSMRSPVVSASTRTPASFNPAAKSSFGQTSSTG